MYTERERERDLERLIICSKANAWNILQPNRKPPKTKNKKVSKEMNLRAQTHHQKKKKGNLSLPKIPLCTNIRPNAKMHV